MGSPKIAYFVILALVCFAPTVSALTQPDGTTIPVLAAGVTECATGGNAQVCLDGEEGGNTINAQTAAAVTPETYTPACSLTFRVIARGAGYDNTFGWYNVVPGSKPDDNDLHAFLECTDDVGTTKPLDIRNDPSYTGGEIGFFMATPEGAAGNCPTFNPGGGPVAGTVGHIYYSERQHNPDNVGANSYVHLITYNSVTHANSFYFAWEDLLAGGDNDFEDLLTRVEGIQCTGGGAPCDTGFDGECTFGTMQCRDGILECSQNNLPSTETCNGVDDDCNGTTDEGDLCPDNEICHQGKCVPPCGSGEFTCAPGLVCNTNDLCVDPACVGVTCDTGQICEEGTCKGWCDGVSCPHRQVCRAGVCVDPCDSVTCDTNYYCELGVCMISCNCGQCAPGWVCDDSTERCVDDGCMGVDCQSGSHCEAGSCVDDCQGAVCPSGESCIAGQCVPSQVDAGTGGAAGSGGGLIDGGFADSGRIDGGATGGSSSEGGAGTGGIAGEAGSKASEGGDDGCGCRTPRPAPASGWTLVMLATLAALGRIRNKTNQKRSPSR